MNDKVSRQATLNSVIDDAVESRLRELHTCTPGIIQSFDPATGRAEIQPAIKRILVNGDLVPLPKLINCPVGVLRVGGFAFTLPITLGDECMIHFTERSLDAWIQFGDIRRPKDIRLHHESDAYFLPVYTSEKDALVDYDSDNMVLRNADNGLNMVFDTDGNLTINAVTTVTMNVPDTQINSNVTVEGTLTVSGKCDLATGGDGVDMNGGGVTQVLTTGSINPVTGTPYPTGNPKITGDA